MGTTLATGTLGTVTRTAGEYDLARVLVDAAIEACDLVLDLDVEWYVDAGVNVTVTLGGKVLAHEVFDTEAEREAWLEGEGLELLVERFVVFAGETDVAAVAA